MKRYLKNKGISLIEIIIGSAIILASLVGLVSAYNYYLGVSRENTERIKADYLLAETAEVLRLFRDESWNNISSLSIGDEYFLELNSGMWSTSTDSNLIENKYERNFIVEEIYRDSNDDIVESGGTLDPNTRKIVAKVSWLKGGATTTKSLSIYLSNIFE